METSLAEDVKKPTRTLSPDSFFFMSPYRSFTTSGCFRRFSQPAVGGDALNGEFQQQMAAAFAEARAAGIRKPVMVGAIPFDTCQPSELYIPERWEAFSRPEKQRSARYAAPLEAMEVVERREIPEQDAFLAMVGTRRRADRHPGSRQSGAIKAYRYYHPRPRRQRRADGATDRPEPRQL